MTTEEALTYIKPMNAAEVSLNGDEWGDNDDPESDWTIAHSSATFVHSDACEFIFYIGDKNFEGSQKSSLEFLKDAGHSEHFLAYFKAAQQAGYKWLNLYTN